MSRLIALDDGHGMTTAGKRTPTGIRSSETGKNFMHENEFNRAVKRYLDKHLKASGFKTLLVAPTDADTPLATRVKRANDAKADLYISIHANANTGKWGTWGGTETYTMPSGQGLVIGRIIHKHLMKGTPMRDRGVKNGSHLYVIKNTRMPAVLIEAGFMDNKREAELLLSDSFRRECAREIAMGICEAYGVKFKDGLGSSSKSNTKPSTKQLYRVRKTWGDAKTQKGAYENLKSAKDLADTLKNQGYKVFNESGKVVYDPSPKKVEKDTWYRVRKTWKDSKSQIGAFQDVNGAKDLADLHAKEGYKVFDDNGKVVYEPKILKVNEFYRVRLSWSNPNTQIGALKDLPNAKELADERASDGYKVFDDNGKVVYTPKVKNNTVTHTVKKGETLWGISQQYKTTVDDIKKANGLKNDVISIGQKLVIKSGSAPKQDNTKVEPKPQPKPQPKPVEQPKKPVAPTQPKPVVDEHKGHHDIAGKSQVSAEKMASFVKSKNPNAENIDEIAKAFIEVGDKYNIRGDIAFCQSIIETGWFRFDGGTAVTPDQHNYCGMGVTSKGMKGASFASIREGVTAQIHHLWAYSNKNPLPNNEAPLSPRFHLVNRGSAPHWEDLSMRWAMNENYGTHILSMYDQLVKYEYKPVEEQEQVEKDNPSNSNDEDVSLEERDGKFWNYVGKIAKLFGVKKK